MQQIFSNTTLTVNQLIEKIDTGELGLPELQRPFIWKDSKVRDLFDSMMCGYPIGYLMLWECPTLEKKKTIGTDTHNYESPKQVIIDGQQRLTSLYAVMKGKKVINSKYDEKSIVISYCPVKNKFEVGYQATKKDPEWIYNISEVFTTSNITKLIINFTKRLDEYRSSKGETLSDEEQDLISENITALSNLKQHTLPVFDIKANAEEEDVSEIFVRVNSGGVALKQNDFILTLLSLYWDEGRKEIEQFSMESTYPSKDKITSYNQLTEVTAQDVIRVVMAYAFDRARLKYGYKLLRGADFDKKGAVDETLRDQRFDVLKAKLPDVLNVHNWHEFLKSIMNAGYLSGDLILSGNAIYYTYAFYLIAKYRFNASYNENMHLTSLWFFYASMVSLYTGSFESTVENHLNSIKELTTLEEYKRFILSRVVERLTNDYFDITLIGSEGLAVSGRGNNAWNAYVAALNILNAKILFSKSNLLVSKLFEPGTDGKRKSLEKHHLFPKAYLKTLGYNDAKINQMANYQTTDLISFRKALVEDMVGKVQELNRENFAVRQHLKYAELYSNSDNYNALTYEDTLLMGQELAPLITPEEDDAKALRFDALIYGIELAYLVGKKYGKARSDLFKKVSAVASVANIPEIMAQAELIDKILHTDYVENAGINEFEHIRENLRDLIKYIPVSKVHYDTNFDDEILSVDWKESELENDDLKNYKAKAEFYVRQHMDDVVIAKLKSNVPLTAEDVQALEKALWNEVGTKQDYEAEYGQKPLGEFVREIVGLDMNAAKEAFAQYLNDASLDSRQIYFVNQIVEYIVHNGMMKDLSVLQEAPFTDHGSIVEVFTDLTVWMGIRNTIEKINSNAVA